MKNNFTPIYTNYKDLITTAHLESATLHQTSLAGFHWRSQEYPHLHNHNHWEFLLVSKGKIQHIINGESYTATKGSACLIRPADTHKFLYIDEHSETLTFCFSNDIANKLLSAHSSLNNVLQEKGPLAFVLNSDTHDAIITKALTAQFCPKDIYEQYAILIINRLLLGYVEQKLNKPDVYPDWLNNFLIYLRKPENFTRPIPEIAQHSTYSYQRLSKLFKQYLGMTLIEYVKNLKLTLAKESLLFTNKSIGEIASDLNYESTSSLNHNFKNATGVTPLEFRKNHLV